MGFLDILDKKQIIADVGRVLRTLAETHGGSERGVDLAYHIDARDVRGRFGATVTPDEVSGFIAGLNVHSRVREEIRKRFTKELSVEETLAALRDLIIEGKGTETKNGAEGYGIFLDT